MPLLDRIVLLLLLLGSAETKSRPDTPPPLQKAADTWTGLYVPVKQGEKRPALDDVAVVVGRTPGEYWVLHDGYLVPAHEEGNALVVPPLPPLGKCPHGGQECKPALTRLDRASGGARIGSLRLTEHASSSLLRALGPGFNLTSVGESGRLRYDHGMINWESRTEDPDRADCVAGILIPDYAHPPVQTKGYSAHAFLLAYDRRRSKKSYPCQAIDPKSQHDMETMSGVALVTNQDGRVVGAVTIGYMAELIFAAEPMPIEKELIKIASIGAQVLGLHVGESAE
jgi:hypothetical protein